MIGKLKEPMLQVTLGLEEIWALRNEVQPLSDVGLIVAQCRILQMQLAAIIAMKERKPAGEE